MCLRLHGVAKFLQGHVKNFVCECDCICGFCFCNALSKSSCVCVCVCVCVCSSTFYLSFIGSPYIHTRVCVCVCVRLRVCIYTTHTHTHTNTHTHTPVLQVSGAIAAGAPGSADFLKVTDRTRDETQYFKLPASE